MQGPFLVTQYSIDENMLVCQDGFKSVRDDGCSCQVGKQVSCHVGQGLLLSCSGLDYSGFSA